MNLILKIFVVGVLVASPVAAFAEAPVAEMYASRRALSTSDLSPHDCGGLWWIRNAIHAEHGYCFKTRQAKRTFGTRCLTRNPAFTGFERQTIANVKKVERAKGCR